MATHSRHTGARLYRRYVPIPPTKERMEINTRTPTNILPTLLFNTQRSPRIRLSRLPFREQVVPLPPPYRMFHPNRYSTLSNAFQVFLFLNTVFWIVGGVLVHQTLGYIECGGVGGVKGGLSECHELKIIEILSWITAASSIIITVPIVMSALKKQKEKAQRGDTKPQRRGWLSRIGFKQSHRAGHGTTAGAPAMSEKHQETV